MNNIDTLVNKYAMFNTIEFYCGDGWFNLLDTMGYLIQAYKDKNPELKFEIDQVKEKFGELRVYFTGTDPYLEGVIDFATNMSSHVCELTGDVGFLYKRNGWVKTLSEQKAIELDYTLVS